MSAADCPGVPNWLRGPSPDVREPEWVPRGDGRAAAELAELRARIAELRDDADPRTLSALKGVVLELIDILSGREDPAP